MGFHAKEEKKKLGRWPPPQKKKITFVLHTGLRILDEVGGRFEQQDPLAQKYFGRTT
jgi:hypothetical protein